MLLYFVDFMGLEKSIENGKEHRKPYYDSRRFDSSCRSHGGCLYCEGNRLYKIKRSEPVFEDDELEELIADATIEKS